MDPGDRSYSAADEIDARGKHVLPGLVDAHAHFNDPGHAYTVLLKPGVMDPVAQTVLDVARMLKLPVAAVRTFRRYYGPPDLPAADRDVLFRKVLANDAIEQIVVGPLHADHLAIGSPYTFRLVTVPLRSVGLTVGDICRLPCDEWKDVPAVPRRVSPAPTFQVTAIFGFLVKPKFE